MSENSMIATIWCETCGWKGGPGAARTDERHTEPSTRDDGTQHDVRVVEYRCPRCGSSGLLAVSPAQAGASTS